MEKEGCVLAARDPPPASIDEKYFGLINPFSGGSYINKTAPEVPMTQSI